MSNRVTLDDDDLEVIKQALILLHRYSVTNPKVYPEYALAASQRMYQIMGKLGIGYEEGEL